MTKETLVEELAYDVQLLADCQEMIDEFNRRDYEEHRDEIARNLAFLDALELTADGEY